MHQQQTVFENLVGKGEIARNEQFLLFPQCFQIKQITVSRFLHIFEIITSFAVELEEPEIGISDKGSSCWKRRRCACDKYYNVFTCKLIPFLLHSLISVNFKLLSGGIESH